MRSSLPDLKCRFVLSCSVIALVLAGPASRHAYYISICEVAHNAQAKTLEITFKIFTDDLEDAIVAQGGDTLRLGTPQEAQSAGRYIFSYLKNNVAFIVAGDTIAFHYVGKEVEMDVAWCYVEAKGVAAIKKIEVMSRLLIELHDEQTNIVHVKTGGARKSLLLHKSKTNGVLEFL